MVVTPPKTKNEFDEYYALRWRILRAPWQQPQGSEKDQLENQSHHLMVCQQTVLMGVGRLHFVSNDQAQIRYMAVDKPVEGQGVGRLLVKSLEYIAQQHDTAHIFLHARDNAVNFYKKLGYEIDQPSYLLFDSIQHYKMTKQL